MRRKVANGMECLAAQIVAHSKEGPGHIYLCLPDSEDAWGEYTYTVYLKEGKLWITVDGIDCPIEKFEKHIEQEV